MDTNSNGPAVIIKSGAAHMDIPVIHRFLSEDSYWGKGISMEVVRNAIHHSYCWGAFMDDRQVGFARLITDYSTFAWLADVFVLREHRGKGISKKMMAFLQEQSWTAQLRRLMLNTLDAHSLYGQFGFKPLANPAPLMEIYRPDIHRRFPLIPGESQPGE